MRTQEIKEKKSWVKPIFDVEQMEETEGGSLNTAFETASYHT